MIKSLIGVSLGALAMSAFLHVGTAGPASPTGAAPTTFANATVPSSPTYRAVEVAEAMPDAGAVAAAPAVLPHPGVTEVSPGALETPSGDVYLHTASEPVDVPLVLKLWRNGAFLNAGFVALYLGLAFWLKLDKKRAFYVAAAMAGIGMLVDAIAAGQQLNMTAYIGAAIAIITALAHSPLQPQPQRDPQGGRVRVEIFAMVMAIFAAAALAVGCHTKTAQTIGNDVKACASDKLGTQVTTLKGLVLTLLGAVADVAMSDDWLAELEHIATQVGEAAVDCAAQDVIAAVHGESSPAVPRLQMWLDHHKHLVSPGVPPGYSQ